MKKLKPVVIFTTFWDAAYLVDSKCVLFDWHGNIKKLNLQSEPCNFSVKSVALSHPSFEKISKLKGIFRGNRDRLDFFCPSYDLLHKYHKDKDWNYYIEKYKEIMRNNKKDIGDWISFLELNNIYILCCWEDTSGVAKCHRKIIYDTLKTSRIAKDKLILIYPTTYTTSSSISRGTMLWRNDRGELITAISDTGTMGASNGVS